MIGSSDLLGHPPRINVGVCAIKAKSIVVEPTVENARISEAGSLDGGECGFRRAEKSENAPLSPQFAVELRETGRVGGKPSGKPIVIGDRARRGGPPKSRPD